MGEQDNKKKDGNQENKGEGEKKEGGGSSTNVVLKLDFHCEGCSTKIVKFLRGLDGVQSVRADTTSNKVTLTVGKCVDPSKTKEKLEAKTRKKVDLISPLPKKDDKNKGKEGGENKKGEKTPDEKKPKEPPVTTAVLKTATHCEGCVRKIYKILSTIKGIHSRSIDREKDTVTVTGTMDAKALAETLKGKLRRPVEIVPPKKEKEGGKKEKDGEKKEKDKEKETEKGQDGGGGGGGGGGGEKKGKGGSGGKKEQTNGTEGNSAKYVVPPNEYGYQCGCGYGYMQPPAPQIFSDENPNACSVM